MHVRADVLESGLAYCPAVHVGCSMHSVARCEGDGWYVSDGQREQSRFEFVDPRSAYSSPCVQFGCSVQLVSLCENKGW